ncbi:MAG: RluA family pseudouridine synthase, partial [Fusobacteriaceae bacterium]
LDKKMKNLKSQNKILVVEKKKETGIKPIEMELKIAYEDRNLLIIDKPPYIIVHPTQKKVDQTLANGVVEYFQRTTGEILIPRFYNRLDMNTSGLIVVAKNAYTQSFLQDTGEVKKYYKAIVKGIMPQDQYLIERPLGKVGDELRRVELSPEEGGQTAKTLITVLERDEKNNLTLVEAELFTGRTHQIRAHLSLEGFPILGDELYGGGDERAGRQMLHSYKLLITNPDTGELMEIKAGIPDDMLKNLSLKD